MGARSTIRRVRVAERIGWGLLGVALLSMLFFATRFDRRSWPSFEGDEATYLMQAESLAWDLDIRYSPEDHRRFVAHWDAQPEGLILQSLDAGRTTHYGKPLPYSLALAPWVRLAPLRGATVFNAVMLALATIAVAASLRSWIGGAAPWFAAAFVFGSVVFAYVPWAHSDLFLASLTASSYALALRRRAPWEEEENSRDQLIAALLLGIVIVCRPFPYAALALPLAVASWPGRRGRARTAAAVAVLAVTVASGIGLEVAARGHWTSYGGQRLSFNSDTGFPADSAGASQPESWSAMVAARGPADWTRAGGKLPYRFNVRTWAWNAWYFLAGRDVGLLPYYPAVLLALFALRKDRVALALAIAFAAVAAGFLLLRPFNFYGGGGALANRYILPAVPALWFLARDTGSPARRAIGLVVVAAMGWAFLTPLWRAPWSFRIDATGGYRWVGPRALDVLPYETTQSHLKPAAREDFVHRALWVKPLSAGLGPVDEGRFLRLQRGTAVDLLVGSPRPITSFCLSRESGDQVALDFRQGLRPGYHREPLPTRVPTPEPTARHAMWWSEDDWWLYRLRLTAAPPVSGEASAAAVQVQLVPGCIDIRRPS
jgi:hypothetical protein